MLTFPSTTAVERIMPKEAFYKQLTLSGELKEKFVSDVKRIIMEYKLTPDTLNIEKGGDTTEILVLSIDLKKWEPDYRIVEAIARQNAHKLLFLLKFEDQGKLALFYNKLYMTDWASLKDLHLETKGHKLDDIWNSFVEQIALQKDITLTESSLPIDERLKTQDAILKLQKEIDKLEQLSRNEKQPKKRFELYQQLKNLKLQLEGLV